MKTRFIFSILLSLIVSIISGSAIGGAVNIDPTAVAGGLFGMSFIPKGGSALFVGVYREIWTGEVIKFMSEKMNAGFLEGLADKSQYVASVGDEAQAIHMVYLDVLPDVLINNTTYPIPLQTIGDSDIVISLDKYQTKQTPITDDELYALSYKKMQNIVSLHGQAIVEAKYKKAVHALAPSGNTAKMPVLVTTGDDDGTGRKRLVWEDILNLKTKCDLMEIPEIGRRLVLCKEHENDLIAIDQVFQNQYYNRISGKPYSQLGFDFYSYVANPYFNPTSKAKIAFGTTPAATDQRATVLFHTARAVKAEGWTKMYYSEAKNDPANQQSIVNFRNYYIVMPTREEARGAIVSANV